MIGYVQNELDQIEREIRRVVPNARSKHGIRSPIGKSVGEVCPGTALKRDQSRVRQPYVRLKTSRRQRSVFSNWLKV